MSDAPPRCEITFENWGYSAAEEAGLRSDPSPDALWNGIIELTDILTSLVDRPDDVTLVIACDLVEAVKLREFGPYTMDRGSSAVAARTMPRANGRVDVIVHGYYLADKTPAGLPTFTAAGYPRLNAEAIKRYHRTIAHEAQHANMEWAGSGFRAYRLHDIGGGAKRLQFEVARKMCDEHRAERNAIENYSSQPPTAKDVLDILCHMGKELADASARYEQSPKTPANRRQLHTEVYNACGPVWTWVALWAAEYRDVDGVGPVPDDIAELKIWQRYIGPAWQTMADALSQLPVEVDTSPDTLHQAAKGVAKAVAKSLEQIGFRHSDNPRTWQETFTVDRQDFPSARE
jgi:hypothetical protein